MDDKVFDLLEKMYNEIQDFKLGLNTEMKDIRKEIVETNRSIVRLEDKMDTNHRALYDGYKLTYEKVSLLREKIDQLDNKLEKHDMEIRMIKGTI